MKKGTKITIGVLTGGLAVAIGAIVKLVRDKMSANNNDEAAEADYDEVNDPEEIEESNSEETTEEE